MGSEPLRTPLQAENKAEEAVAAATEISVADAEGLGMHVAQESMLTGNEVEIYTPYLLN